MILRFLLCHLHYKAQICFVAPYFFLFWGSQIALTLNVANSCQIIQIRVAVKLKSVNIG